MTSNMPNNPLTILDDFRPKRNIINRVSYQYLDPEAVFQLMLFVKTQVTSGGMS